MAVYVEALEGNKIAPREARRTQSNLGKALAGLGERFGNAARLEVAIVAYRHALSAGGPEPGRQQWAQIKHNLGDALKVLGALSRNPARLEEAIASYREALTVHTREKAPQKWVLTQRNLGHALNVLSEISGDSAQREDAIKAMSLAQEVSKTVGDLKNSEAMLARVIDMEASVPGMARAIGTHDDSASFELSAPR